SAYADAYRTTGNQAYRHVAERAALFVTRALWSNDALLHCTKDGEANHAGLLDDYAALGLAFLDLFESTFDGRHLEWAERLAERMLGDFWDGENGGFYYTSAGHEQLIARTKPVHDGSVPSGNSLAAMLCLRLHAVTERAEYLDRGERVLRLHRDG